MHFKFYKFLALLLILVFSTVWAIGQVFQRYNTELGLPYNEVFKICQDEEGLIYVGTANGVNVLGGSWFKQYNSSNTSGFSNSVVDIVPIQNNMLLLGTEHNGIFILLKEQSKIVRLNLLHGDKHVIIPIRTLHKDVDNNIWVGTRNEGLFNFHVDSIHSSQRSASVMVNHYSAFNNKTVSDISSTKDNLWVGTLGEGVFSFDRNSSKQTQVLNSNIDLTSKNVWTVEHFNDTLFIGTEKGLFMLDLRTGEQSELLDGNGVNIRGSIIVRSISKDKANNFWIGSQESGLFKLWSLNGKWQVRQFKSGPNNISGLNTNKILSTYTDSYNNIWIGTWDGGILRYSEKDGDFKNVRNHSKASIISENMTKCIVEKDGESYWIGTYGNGICEYRNSSDSFVERIDIKDNNSVSSMYHDKERGLLLAGSWGFGLKIYDSNTLQPKFSDLLHHPKLNNDRVYSIIKDINGIYWLATIKHGLFSLNLNSGNLGLKYIDFSDFISNPLGKDAEFREIIQGKRPNTLIIIKHDYGIYEVETDSEGDLVTVKDLLQNTNLQKQFNINFLKCGFFDRDNNFLVGTNNGILLKKSGSKTFEVILEDENIVAHDIIEDSRGDLWIASYAGGIIKYSSQKNEIKKYLSTSIFFKLHYSRESDLILAASHSGLYQFTASLNENDPFYPEVYFNNLSITDRNISPGDTIKGKIGLPKHINYLDEIVLPYSHNSFSFNINAVSYSLPEQNNIMYRMEGIDNDWNDERAATVKANYRNIPHGDYIFKAKVSNKDNVWNPEIKSIYIKVLPPWWRTKLAYVLYGFIILLSGFIIVLQIQKKNRSIRERKIREITFQKEEALNEQKLHFFTNISHEIRTPLTLILGPLEDILARDKPGTWLNKQHKVMHKNASLLLRLINEILDFRKLEHQMLSLNYSSIDISSFTRDMVGQFESVAKQKEIDLFIKESIGEKQISADRDKLEKVVLNLLANAINHTSKGGFVEVALEKTDDMLQLSVKDNGEGIAKEDIPHIFTRFYQSNKKSGMGTGIGLALAQKIVELHGGTINVESEPGIVTLFTLKLPEGPKIVNEQFEEKVHEKSKNNEQEALVSIEQNEESTTNDVAQKKEILVVDDNADIRDYLYDNLSDLYKVHTAEDGEIGMRMAKKIIPSLIICDIMMDGIDGIEVCETLKGDIITSHIPFILLTSKNSEESTIEGFEKGADDYITKPFSSRVLKIRVQNLIEQRNQLQKKYSLLDIPENKPDKSIDEEFITTVIAFIEENLSNADQTVDDIAQSVKLTHDQYYRKIKNITGLTANKFTRKVRLNKARGLLHERRFNVSEIMYKVGFSSASYFTRSFKEEFGVTPTEMLEKRK